MYMLWIVQLALLILLEKVASFGRQIALQAGVVFIAVGMFLDGNVLTVSVARHTRMW